MHLEYRDTILHEKLRASRKNNRQRFESGVIFAGFQLRQLIRDVARFLALFGSETAAAPTTNARPERVNDRVLDRVERPPQRKSAKDALLVNYLLTSGRERQFFAVARLLPVRKFGVDFSARQLELLISVNEDNIGPSRFERVQHRLRRRDYAEMFWRKMVYRLLELFGLWVGYGVKDHRSYKRVKVREVSYTLDRKRHCQWQEMPLKPGLPADMRRHIWSMFAGSYFCPRKLVCYDKTPRRHPC